MQNIIKVLVRQISRIRRVRPALYRTSDLPPAQRPGTFGSKNSTV